MIVSTYRSMVGQLTAGINFCREYFAERYAGTIGLASDLLAEGLRAGFVNHLPGHPEQAEDATNQQGSDAGLFRYRGESLASWKSRVGDPWPLHEQAGTDVALLRELDLWGSIVFPLQWAAHQAYVAETQWARMALFIPHATLPWGGAFSYGTGLQYGQPNLMYGLSGAVSEDVATLKRIVRAIKPSRSKASVIIMVSGWAYGQRNTKYGDGKTYGADGIRFTA